MPKTKALHGNSPCCNYQPLSDATKEKLKKCLELDPYAFAELVSVCERFMAETKTYSPENWSRTANIKASIQELLYKQTGTDGPLPSLLKALKELDFKATLKLHESQDWVNIDDLISQLEILQGAAEDCLKTIPKDKTGRNVDMAMQTFIDDLISFYEKHTGNQAKISKTSESKLPGRKPEEYYGPFFDFVMSCLTILGYPPQSNTALGKALYRNIKKGQKSPKIR